MGQADQRGLSGREPPLLHSPSFPPRKRAIGTPALPGSSLQSAVAPGPGPPPSSLMAAHGGPEAGSTHGLHPQRAGAVGSKMRTQTQSQTPHLENLSSCKGEYILRS